MFDIHHTHFIVHHGYQESMVFCYEANQVKPFFLVNIQTDIVNWDQKKSTKYIKGLIYQ